MSKMLVLAKHNKKTTMEEKSMEVKSVAGFCFGVQVAGGEVFVATSKYDSDVAAQHCVQQAIKPLALKRTNVSCNMVVEGKDCVGVGFDLGSRHTFEDVIQILKSYNPYDPCSPSNEYGRYNWYNPRNPY